MKGALWEPNYRAILKSDGSTADVQQKKSCFRMIYFLLKKYKAQWHSTGKYNLLLIK